MNEDMKNYYVFSYVYDPVVQGFTSIEGEVQGYTKATDPFEACKNLGFEDFNHYFAKPIEKLEEHEKGLKDEAAKVKKLQEQLQPMIDERKKEVGERKCPNCGSKLDDEYNCPDCGFGHEAEEMKKALDAAKKLAKKPTKKAKK